MRTTHLFAFAVAAVLGAFTAAPAAAQLVSPDASGVTMGHIHIDATDVDAHVRFFTAIGGKVVQRDKLLLMQFPGVYIAVRKQDPKGGTVGSSVNHIGFYVRDFEPSVAKFKAAGMDWAPMKNPEVGQGFLTGPDGLRVEIYENKSISAPVAFHHVHLAIPDPAAGQKWYVDNFGAKAGTRAGGVNPYLTANVSGTEITMGKSDKPMEPTTGRVLDHIGFEVKNLDALVAKLKAAGAKMDGPPHDSTQASGLRVVHVYDPWGTDIELSEGLMKTPVVTQ